MSGKDMSYGGNPLLNGHKPQPQSKDVAVTRTCGMCGAEYITYGKYCSDDCRAGAAQLSRLKYREQHRAARPKAAPRVYHKICPHCGVEFAAGNAQRVYCSGQCQSGAAAARWAATQAAAQPQVRTCAGCGKEFPATAKNAKYCGVECRSAAQSARARERWARERYSTIQRRRTSAEREADAAGCGACVWSGRLVGEVFCDYRDSHNGIGRGCSVEDCDKFEPRNAAERGVT